MAELVETPESSFTDYIMAVLEHPSEVTGGPSHTKSIYEISKCGNLPTQISNFWINFYQISEFLSWKFSGAKKL